MKGRLHQLLIAITLCLAGTALLHADEDSLAIGQIRDLPFGEVLFQDRRLKDRKKQISDHLPVWAEFEINKLSQQLDQIINVGA